MTANGEGTHDGKLNQVLRLAFLAPEGRPPTVLDEIARRAGDVPRLVLRDEPSDTGRSPLVDAHSSEQGASPRGRAGYQLLGEIARGGMGVILKGHDLDLGRDVAIKVLRKDRADSPALLQRFIEEAQIGGQLQHPGIVPVYELGLMEDRRPYFSMKLVKGRTLSENLAARRQPGDDRRRLLSIFEQICQTVAYAHARGVIHRDLKPANVMVGPFGEVLVMDWGLAKVLRRGGTADEKRAKAPEISVIETVRSTPGSTGSDSLVGSVMGTPAYMSPEQARGEIERVDERSDVFALGAILCEILTGQPPYSGEGEDTLALAAHAKLEPAFERLAGSDADRELVAILKSCLVAAPSARFRNAEALGQEVGAHLAATEERARLAQIDAAETRVKVAEERKRRKLSVALLGSLLAVVLVGGGAWMLNSQAHHRRMARGDREIGKVIDQAARLRGERRFDESLASVVQAEAMLASGAASGDTSERVAALRVEVQGLADAARVEEERARRNRRLLDRLKEIEAGSYAEIFLSDAWLEIDASYEAAFREYGLEPLSTGVERTAEILRDGGVGAEAWPFLDRWGMALRHKIDAGEKWKLLYLAAGALDPDPFRARIRAAVLEDDRRGLRELAQSADPTACSSATAKLLAPRLWSSGFNELGGRVLLAALRRDPDDFFLNYALGLHISRSDVFDVRDSLRWYAVAHALRPDSSAVVSGLSNALRAVGKDAEALQVCRDAVARTPESANMRTVLARALSENGDIEGALVEFRQAIRIEPANSFHRLMMSFAQKNGGDLTGALATLREAQVATPNTVYAAPLYMDASNICLKLGRLDEAQRDLDMFLRLLPGKGWPYEQVGYMYRRHGYRDLAIEHYRRGLELEPKLLRCRISLARLLEPSDRFELLDAGLALLPDDPSLLNEYAWQLATVEDEGRRDGLRAVELARRAYAFDPRGGFVTSLGVGLYRTGDLKGAIETLHESMDRDRDGKHGNANHWLFLAMALARRGEHAEAREWFDKAVEWIAKQEFPDPDLPRFRAEAAAVLGIDEK